MSLHGLLSVTIGVPNVEETAAYYAEFGLAPEVDGWFSTLDAGHGLHRRGPAVDAGRPRGRPRPVRLGTPAAALVHAPGSLAAMMTGAHSAR